MTKKRMIKISPLVPKPPKPPKQPKPKIVISEEDAEMIAFAKTL
jgi:hypothetical protein